MQPTDTTDRPVPEPTTSEPAPVVARAATASWALFAGVALLMVGNGLQGSLLGVRAELEGFSTAVSGTIMAAYFTGFLIGSRAATRALTSVGHIRVFAALASLASSATLAHALAVHPLAWLVMRFTTGVCMAGLYVVIESWINGLATNANRGRLLAAYIAVSMGGMAGGQLLLGLATPEGVELFLVASVLVSLALVPVSLSTTGAPPSVAPEPMSLRQLIGLVPTGPTVAALVGIAHGALLGMGAFHATRAGLDPSATALFMFCPMVGGMVLQVPIGLLSDWLPRRGVMLAVASMASGLAALLLVVPPGSAGSFGLLFLLGGCSFPLYSLGIAHTNDWIRPDQATAASAALVTANGIGALAGPVLAAGLMVSLGNEMFFVTLVAAHGAIAAYLVFRVAFREGLPRSRQGRFVAIPARASATAIAVLARRRQEPKGSR